MKMKPIFHGIIFLFRVAGMTNDKCFFAFTIMSYARLKVSRSSCVYIKLALGYNLLHNSNLIPRTKYKHDQIFMYQKILSLLNLALNALWFLKQK